MSMSQEEIMNKLLAFEESHDLLTLKYDNSEVIIWSQLRGLLFRHALFNYSTQRPLLNVSIRKKIIKYILYFYRVLRDVIKPYKKKSFLFVTNNIYNVEKKNNKFFNWLHDPYAELYPNDSFILERSFDYTIKQPRSFNLVKSYDAMLIRKKLLNRFVKVSNSNREKVESLLLVVKEYFPFDLEEEFIQEAREYLITRSKEIEVEYRYWDRVLSRISPKIVFVDDGSYGGSAVINIVARKQNIIPCEFQHGLVDNLHDAYNYSNSVINSVDFSTHLPESILLFGNFWKKSYRTSSNLVVIGSPKMDSTIHKKDNNSIKKNILFISSAFVFDELKSFILQLCQTKIINEYELILRPHPTDYALMGEYILFSRENNITIQNNCSIIDAIDNAFAVVVMDSTVAYEAVAREVPCFILRNEFSDRFPESLSDQFDTVDEFISLLESPNKSGKTICKNDMYDTAWKSNYKRFIEQVLK